MFFKIISQYNVELYVYVTTGAKKTHMGGLYDMPEATLFGMNQALKIKVTAPPRNGEANEQIQAMLAKALNIRKNAVILISGKQARIKLFTIQGDQNTENILMTLGDTAE